MLSRNKSKSKDDINNDKQKSIVGADKGSPRRFKLDKRSLGFILVFALIGTYLIVRSLAATPAVSTNVTLPTDKMQAKRLTLELVTAAHKLQKSPGNQTLIAQIQQLAQQRQQVLVNLMNEDANKAVQVQFPSNLISILPPAAQVALEKNAVIQGKLTVTHGESINPKTQELENPIYYYELTDASGTKYKLHYNGQGLDDLGGAVLKVNGVQTGSDVALTSLTDTQVVQASTLGSPSGYKKVAVVLLNFSDNATQPWTPDQVATSVFGTSGSTDNLYYQEASFEKYGLTGIKSSAGDVFGWYTLNDTSSSCNYSTWSSDAAKAAAAAGVSLSGYDNVIYAFPHVSACSWAGLGQMPGHTVWINGYATTASVTTHELGHNLGAAHASRYVCTDASGVKVTLSSTCTSEEYGDTFDVMGGGLYHFNNYHKGELGYLSSNNTQTVTSSGTYAIAPIEQPSSGVQSLRIPKDYNSNGQPISYYYLEARQPSVFDNWTSGSSYYAVFSSVLVRFAPDYAARNKSQLLDMHPETSLNGDAGLAVGGTFTDSQRNISIATQGVDNTGATVQVTIGQVACVHNNPTVSVSPATQWANPGDTLSYTLTVKNNDGIGCQSSTFNLTSSLSPELAQSPASTQVSLAPGASTTISFALSSSSSTNGGYYQATETITNNAATTSTSSVTANYNVYNPADTTAPTVSITNPANGATVSGRTIIKATAADDVGVTAMEIYIDSKLVNSSTSGSISYNWNTRKVAVGSHVILVKAYDATGNIGQSSITVKK